MQLHIVNRDHQGYTAGDILAVLPDIHVWSPLEVASLWLATNPLGLPDRYKTVAEGGTFPPRTAANFPNPWSAVARFPSYRCDLNLADTWLEIDLTELGAFRAREKRLWFLDLDALPPGQRSSLQQPGGEGTLGANRLSAVRNKHNGGAITDVAGWDTLTQANTRHRYSGTSNKSHVGVG